MGRGFSMLVWGAAFLGLMATGSQAAERPNFLWISCEDISPDLGCYGDAYAISPTIDRLAAEGVRFTRAFSHSGVCAPTRSGIITGMYPTTIGTHHMRCKGVPPAEVRCFSQYLRAEGYYCTNNRKTDYQFDSPLTAWDESHGKAHWRNRADGQPFFAVINLTISHESQIRSPSKQTRQLVSRLSRDERHDPATAPLPPYYPDTPLVRRDWANYHDNITAMDKQVAGILRQLEEDGLAEETIVWFWGDHGRGLPRGKRWIYDSGLQVPLIIRVPKKWRKHTLPGADEKLSPGTVNDDLVAFIDFAPTMLSLAGIKIPAHIQGQAFLGAQKTPPRKYIFAARDRMDERYDLIRAVRDKRFKYIRNFRRYVPYSQDIWYMNKMPTLQEMRRLNAAGKLMGPQRLYFQKVKPLEELYDTQGDPHEINNLADDPQAAAQLKELRGELKNWMIETGDVGLIPEPEFDEMKRPGGKYAKTAAPEFLAKKSDKSAGTYQVAIQSATPGSSIAYRLGSDLKIPPLPKNVRWKLYTEPVTVKPGYRLYAISCRIGFRDGEMVTFRPGQERQNAKPAASPIHWRDKLKGMDLLAQLLELRSYDEAGMEAVPKYLAALKNEHASVRYWAIVGLHRNTKGEGHIKSSVSQHLDDPSPVVRVAAAQALCDFGEAEKGLPVLAKLLEHRQDATRLHAAIALGELGEKARPVLRAIRGSLNDQYRYVMRVSEITLERLESK